MFARSRLFTMVMITAVISTAFLAVGQTANSDGEGTYKFNGETTHLTRATIKFGDNDSFVVTLVTKQDKRLEVRGRYTGQGHHRDLKARNGLGHNSLNGSGEVTLSDNEATLRSLTLHGDIDGDPFHIAFNDRRNATDEDADRHSFSDHIVGTGKVEVGDHMKRVTNLRVNMARNGDLTLTAEGPDLQDTTWEGRWKGKGPQYDIDLRHSGHYEVHATGTLTLSKNNKAFKSLEVNGKEDGKALVLKFHAND